LWDNPAYLLGYKADDNKPDRTKKSFDAFRARHLEVKPVIDDAAFSAVCSFLEQWDPAQAEKHETLVDISTGFGVFRLRGEEQFIHGRDAVQAWWRQQLASIKESDKGVLGQCLVTGEFGPLARLHEPKIKGVWGAQTAGALLVSFNESAYESYGRESKKAGFNAPVSEQSAFQYCTALNRLLAKGSTQRIQVGDASTVFWTEQPSEAENLLPWIFESAKNAEDETLKNAIEKLLRRVAAGVYPTELGKPDTPFYVLGLSPNAARISVRFWWPSTLGTLIENLHLHFKDLQIAHSARDQEFPSVWQLLRETVRDSKDIPPILSGTVMRSVLTGVPYPSMLFSSIVRRIRADREVHYIRASAIKACLNRNTRFGIEPLEKEIAMSLDIDRPEPAYRLGRLFAELEKTQEDAARPRMINATIKDRYFGAASATPSSVFPRLIRLSQHHLGKLEKGERTYHEKRIQEITCGLDDFASHLSLRDQGLFAIGYYHQRHDIFTKKSDKTSENTSEKE
jgi:CRISPR-associated protein Csd1